MKTRTALMLVIALLVVASLPASATDSKSDACDGLINALDVLENQTKANQRAIDNLTARADAAGCIDFPESRGLCQSIGGTFIPDGETIDRDIDGNQPQLRLWTCEGWTYENDVERISTTSSLGHRCVDDGGNVLNDVPTTFDPEILFPPLTSICSGSLEPTA